MVFMAQPEDADENNKDETTHMYPDAGPAEDCQSPAERKLYRRLREYLGPDFYVIHSAKWNNVAANGRMEPGEADFVIIHRELGIAVIEVKGGTISQDPTTRRWKSIDQSGEAHPLKMDPFDQAMRSVKVLERKLPRVPATAPFARDYRICYGVWFPDMVWNRDGRGSLQSTEDILLDRTDALTPRASLTKLMKFAQGDHPADPLSDTALSALLGLLAPDFTRVESPLVQEMTADDQLLSQLTLEQADRLMAMWNSHRQMVIPGYAGTGKTIIAMEMAWKLAASGSHVLMLCANLTLAEYLRQRMKASENQSDPSFVVTAPRFEIRSLAELVGFVVDKGQVRRYDAKGLSVAAANDQEKLAALLSANLGTLAKRGEAPIYDALLVDEAQDINQSFWPNLRRLLRVSDDADVPDASYFYVFYDPAQRDLPGAWDAQWTGISEVHAPLTVNCRNTEYIYETMKTFNPGLREVPFQGPIGRPVAYRDPAKFKPTIGSGPGKKHSSQIHGVDKETATLEQVLNGLIEVERVTPEQILVITCRSRDGRSKRPTRWRLTEQQQLGRRILEWIRATRSQTRITLSTIRSSKGLESPVVVLTELDGVSQDPKRDQLLYIAISRAKHQLIVLAPPETLTPIRPDWWKRLFARPLEAQLPLPLSKSVEVDPFVGPEDPDHPAEPQPKQEKMTSGDDDGVSPLLNPRRGIKTRSAATSAIGKQVAITPDTSSQETTAGSSSSATRTASVGQAGGAKRSGMPGARSSAKSALGAKFKPSDYQVAIFDFIRNGQGNGIVSAVAGSGKTTILVEAANLLKTRNAVFLAFNVHIARSLGQLLRGTPMSASTIHSVGRAALQRYFGQNARIELDSDKYMKMARTWAQGNLPTLDRVARQQAGGTLNQLVDLARKTLTPPSDAVALRTMAAHFGVSSDVVPLDVLLQAVPHLIAYGGQVAKGSDLEGVDDHIPHFIDFTDMLYLSHVWRLPARWNADWVFVDEAQDLNVAQLDLALKCCGPHGRMLFVGDRHQAIYGFSGADSDAFDRIKRVTKAKEFPLSVCYRCPRSHIALAQELVPEIQPRDDAPQGELATITLAQVPQLVRERKDDLILSRKTAPLLELCIQFIRNRIFARVKGHEIGLQLTQVVQTVTHLHGYTWQRFGQFLQEYQRQQAEKIRQFDNGEAELERLDDHVAAVRVCYEMFQAQDAAELCRNIEDLFRDDQPDVTLSTIHRAKGLEAERILLLNPDEMPLKWPNQQAWELEQERNIKYVALTRAKRELYLVSSTTT